MRRNLQMRFFLLAAFTLASLVLFLPSTPLSERLPQWWQERVPKITLGLDLQGGMYLLLEIQVEKALEHTAERLATSISDLLKEKGISVSKVSRVGATQVRVEADAPEALDQVGDLVPEEFSELDSPRLEEGAVTFMLASDYQQTVRDWAAQQAKTVIDNRIDKFGVREPKVRRQGNREMVIELPGLKDPKRALALIGKTAVLEFKLVDNQHSLESALQGDVPEGSEIVYQRVLDRKTQEVVEKRPFLVKKSVLLTGEVIVDARVSINQQFNEPYVGLTFNRLGTRRFAKVTREHVGENLAIVLDGNVYSAPVIREAITGGNASIEGGFTFDEARDLAIVLRAGALPAPVKILQNETVGPTLGRDSIEKGVRAMLVGGALVLGFMVFYYRLSGVISDVALVLNILMLLGILALFEATLTLPGIAGIILTMGMGVDSNVLIFERIKEEQRLGKTVRSAIDAGYSRAFTTIVDSHVTTLLTAAVLFQFGSGPIRGFAVTLSVGIIVNLFTALVGTKVVYDFVTSRWRLKRLSI